MVSDEKVDDQKNTATATNRAVLIFGPTGVERLQVICQPFSSVVVAIYVAHLSILLASHSRYIKFTVFFCLLFKTRYLRYILRKNYLSHLIYKPRELFRSGNLSLVKYAYVTCWVFSILLPQSKL